MTKNRDISGDPYDNKEHLDPDNRWRARAKGIEDEVWHKAAQINTILQTEFLLTRLEQLQINLKCQEIIKLIKESQRNLESWTTELSLKPNNDSI